MREQTLLTGRSEKLHGRFWSNDSALTGVIIAVHGLGDHSERYETLAAQLCAAGWGLFVFDLQGHGRSPGTRGRIDSYGGLLADVAAARLAMQRHLPDLPQILLGHSMGGNVALNYALRRNELDSSSLNLSGLALISPMILPTKPPRRPHVLAAWLTGQMFPWIRVDKRVPHEQLTRDPAEAAALQNDSLSHSQISIRLATELLAQGRWALDHAREVTMPTLIMHGDDDQLIDQSACEHLAIRIGDSATYIRQDEMRHDLFHDHGRQQAMQALVEWLDQVPL